MKLVSAQYDKNDKSTEALGAKSDVLTKKLEAQKDKVDLLKKQYSEMATQYDTNKQKNEALAKKYDDEKAKLTTLGNTLGTTSDEYQEQVKVVDDLEKELQQSEKAQDSNAKAMSNLRIQMNNAEADVAKTSKEIDDLAEEMKEGAKASDKLGDGVEKAGKDAEDSAKGGFTVFKGALANLVSDVIQNAISALKDLAAETIQVGADFDSSMSNVGAISGATGKDLDTLRSKAKEMGSTTKFTATQAADAFSYMAMAGWKTNDMIKGIDGVLKLAAASGADLATTSDIVTDALTGMGYSAKDAGRLADVMAAASSNANTNVELMGATFQYAAPIVGALGLKMEDTAVAIGLMANAGIKGEKAGTALRSILTRLSTNAGATKNSMGALEILVNKLGVQFYNTDGTVRNLNDVLGEARTAWKGLSAEQQTSYGKTIAGQEALSGWLSLMNAAPEDVEKLTTAINNADGAADKMAATMLDNLGGDMTLLKSKLEGVQLAIYEKFEPALRKGVEVLSKLLDAVQFVVDHSAEFTAALTGMATAVGAYLAYTTAITVMTKGWAALTVVTKAQAAAQAVLNAVMSANPIGIVIGLIAGLVAAFVVLWNKSEGFRNFWIGLWETIKKAAEPIVKSIVTNFTNAWDLIKKAWSAATSFFTTVWNGIKTVFSVVKNVLSGFFIGAWTAIKAKWDIVGQYFKTVWESIKLVFSVVKDVLSGNFQGAWDAIKAIVNQWKLFFSNVWENIKGVFAAVDTWFSSKFGDAWAAIKKVFSPFAEFFKGLWDKVKNTFTDLGTKIGDAIGKAVKSGINGIISQIERVINSGIGLINGAIGLINKLPGVSVGKVSTVKFNRLARGGVVDGATFAEIGEDGAEAIVPLENNTGWITRVAEQLASALVPAFTSATKAVNNANNNNSGYNDTVEAFKDALGQMKIVLDDEEMGSFIEKTVADAIYT